MSTPLAPAPSARRPPPTVLTGAALVGALVALALASLAIGQVSLAPADVGRAFTSPGSVESRIVIDLRLPRVVGAVAAGAGLGVAGLLMQGLFRNPLADPWSLGLTAGGQLGAALVVVAGAVIAPALAPALGLLAGVPLVAGAAAGSLGVALAMAALARRVGTVTLLVLGLMLGFLAQGLISVVLHFTNRTQGRVFASWNDGTFAGLAWADLVAFLPPILLGLGLAGLLVKPLTALLLGEAYAASLGTDVPRLRRLVLLAVILLASPVTAYCGPIVFVGLIVPHVARGLLQTAAVRSLLPVTALLGSVLALGADLVVHLPWREHFLHLNAILAVLGAPVVIGMLLASRSLRANAL